MEKLYAGSRELESIEGIVKKVSAISYPSRQVHYMKLQIDTFDEDLFIQFANYRIDIGERVRLYSSDGFKEPNLFRGFEVNGVQVLDENGNLKFQYTNSSFVEFK